MSARDKDARAAMREIMRSWHDAWGYADAMEAERAKRETPKVEPASPCDPAAALTRALEHLETAKNEEVEKAHREGRDAGLREAVARLTEKANASGVFEGMLSPYTIATVINEMITNAPPPPKVRADDAVLNIALASENAKLRAVAEAAARLQRLRDSNRPDGIGEASLQLDGALGNWLPGWRTK